MDSGVEVRSWRGCGFEVSHQFWKNERMNFSFPRGLLVTDVDLNAERERERERAEVSLTSNQALVKPLEILLQSQEVVIKGILKSGRRLETEGSSSGREWMSCSFLYPQRFDGTAGLQFAQSQEPDLPRSTLETRIPRKPKHTHTPKSRRVAF